MKNKEKSLRVILAGMKTLEERRAYDTTYRETHREKIREYNRRWRQKNSARCNAWSKQWREKNPDRQRATSRRVRERQLGRGLKWIYTRPEVEKLGTFDQRLTDAGDHYILLVASPFGVVEVRFDKDLLEIVRSANSIRVFNSNKTNYSRHKQHRLPEKQTYYVQLLWLHPKKPGVPNKIKRCLYLHRIAMGLEDAGRSLHAHHTSLAINTLDCRREVLEVLTASEHSKRTAEERRLRREQVA